MRISNIFCHNWLASIYLNFKMLPLRQAIKLPLDVFYGIRFVNLQGSIVLNSDKIYRGMIKIGAQGADMFQRNKCIMAIEGKLVFNGSCVFGCSNTVKIRKGAEVIMGNHVILGANNLIYSEKKIVFGDEFLSSWQCQFMDSDTHSIIDTQTLVVSESVKSIFIGKHCWMGNHVIINKGVRLPSNTIVASNSLVNKDYSSNGDFCILAGIPASVIKRNKKWAI